MIIFYKVNKGAKTMLKKSVCLLGLVMLVAGCAREVYLEPVPCVEGTCECPCYKDNPLDCCKELQVEREVQRYQIIDMPTEEIEHKSKDCAKTKKCRKVCKEVKVEK